MIFNNAHKKQLRFGVLSFVGFLLTIGVVIAQGSHSFQKLGKLKTLTANEIGLSRWSIGGETLDRDYADYQAYKEYLGPLGAKRIRLQAGWAKCEKEKGKYNFEWLDQIVEDALSQGVNPWLQTSYGNPIYEGGGDAALAGGIPTSEEALEAWDKWVEALVKRYKAKVNEWEIWNEPDISKKFTAEEFAAFHVRTADIIKRVQPNAKIIALGLAGPARIEYVQSILDRLKADNKISHFDVLSFHGYAPVPETSYQAVAQLRVLLDSYNPEIQLWQGENGAPSTPQGQSIGALRQYDWSEISQAKWVLRRMLADMGNGVDVTNIFQISDMHYGQGDHLTGLNSKGLLQTNPDNTVVKPKVSYFAFQHAATIFSEEIVKFDAKKIKKSDLVVEIFAYKKSGVSGSIITIWNGANKPEDDNTTKPISFEINNVEMDDPVLVDLLDGAVYVLPKSNFKKVGDATKFIDIPVGDWPVVILDKNQIELD